jgi:MFS family permease
MGTMQFGAGLSASGQTFLPLSVQLKWSDDEMNSKISLLSSSCSYGIAIGSILSGFLVRYGKRNIIVAFELIGIIGSIISCIMLDFNVICIGRFIYGCCCGALISTCPQIIEETVPFTLID